MHLFLQTGSGSGSGSEAHNIIYESMKLNDYLNPCSNLKLEEQRNIFSLRSRMNELKTNFSRNQNINSKYCLNDCGKELNNEHLKWCQYMNKESDLKYLDILNGDLQQKVNTFKQIQRNQELRKAERTKKLSVKE